MQQFQGVLTLTPVEAFLNATRMEIDDPDCVDDQCRSKRARDFFVSKGLDTGSPVTVTGVMVNTVLVIIRQ